MRKLIYKLQFLIYPIILWYYRKPRIIKKRGIKLLLNDTVFHPNFYLSTDLLLDYVKELNLNGKNVLELGCGSGFISLYLAKHHQVKMYASDINPNATAGLIENSKKHDLKIEVFESDLFSNIPNLKLDLILVNPPYFKSPINKLNEYAFYSGANHEYFISFFKQIKHYVETGSKVVLILSENVQMAEIEEIALTNKLIFLKDDSVIKFGERFDFYILEPTSGQI